MRVVDARSGKSLPDSKISVQRCEEFFRCGPGEQELLVDKQPVKEEYKLYNTNKSERLEFYRIDIDGGLKYFLSWATKPRRLVEVTRLY